MTAARIFDITFGNLVRFAQNAAFRKEEHGPVSWGFVGTLLLVLCYGLIMLFSASYVTAYYRFGDIYHYIKPQVILALGGLFLMVVISNIDYHALRYLYAHLYVGLMFLLVLALFSEEINNVHRWVYILGINVQPSEIAKFAVILGVALYTDEHYEQRRTLVHGMIMPILPVLPIVVLLRMEPHNSAILLICMILGTMLLCGGCALRWMPVMAGVAMGGLYLMLTAEGNDVANERLGAWGLFAESDVDLGYQTTQSLYSIASGGLTGLGIGNSRQKQLWLPEATNDFIFSVLCEELGFIGAVLCIGLFAALLIQGILIALRSPDYFGSMLTIGVMAQIAWQVFCHIGVVTATLPNTGISLPFFSSGGSSLLLLLCEMGVVLSVSRAGNAKIMAQRKRSQDELMRRLHGNSPTRKVYRRRENVSG
ncbi:putative peptidoglycan glycosyltransferase FtsW [uncultured Gemmiger sp.]|uniref:FtsW/RodA/SpoVE family cell cycle protein n=1 Tax=uncultured Gemmiger sp. TaxID=1623490 RepID=UPI0025D136C9|nr:putative peptidoglycan glycosyltransferase FtsW [uncultured Gemmiger sp.]